MARRGENIYKRKDGRYEGRYIKKHGLDGKAVYGYVYSRSYSEVKKKLLQCKTEIPISKKGSNLKLSAWLMEWIDNYCTAKETTKYVYISHICNHITPVIGEKKLSAITHEILQNFINSIKLSPSTVRVIFNVLKSALRSAEEMGYTENVWSKIKLPQRQKTKIDILTPSQQQQLEQHLHAPEDIGILICLYTGLRIGELCALKWEDIDIENKSLYIKETQARGRDGIYLQSPKSSSSQRIIPIPDILYEKLSTIQYKTGFIVSYHGKAYDVRSYRRRFKRLLKQAGLPDIRFHALRHTFSSRALEVGMDYKTLSEILGHSSVSITLDIYAHSLNEHKKNEINKLNSIFSPSE